ncbi:MAG: ATP-dependent carboxylate-amine ligase [Deltaproteobacteria bacterium CG11_big_fil_rev_8_21_14_0_20_42_23]|nr:MAG: ATP-dependent carboxylate-amine ligase [Deltaproteobacteria bacterium CG11_big_fil_rev_8_21_14_0_20_42_23]PJC64550.1 MAG: ATP-dependent carboxylate-amine ligase [Deltaproteobacteria bacterium CG_4_9_14_0_2_um_filter_42_21]
MKKLLFTGGGGAGAEALLRLLSGRYKVHFADADYNAKPHFIPLSSWHKIPFASDPSFVDEVCKLCCKLDVDLLIPGVDEELVAIAHARDDMQCEVMLPSMAFIKTHLDKLTSNSLLQKYKLPVPKTELLFEHQNVLFPCIAKPRQGRGSRGVAIVHSKEELQAHVIISRRQPEDFIVQELLQGQEYTVMIAADRDGQLRAVVPVKVEIKKGITIRAMTDHDEKVISACVAIHTANPVFGCYNIQLIKTKNGDVKPFEINPRISTTSCLALAAGVDFIDVYLGNKKNKNYKENDLLPFRNGFGLRRSWHNEFIEELK